MVYNGDGTLNIDKYARAKDTLVLGSQGTAKAEDKAKKAEDQKAAVLAVSQEDLLKKARSEPPEAFE